MALRLRLQQACDGRGAPSPVVGFDGEWLFAFALERVIPCPPRILRVAPLGVEQPGALEPLERGEQRAWIDFEDAARDLLDAPSDAETVHRLEAEGFEDQHVQRALNDVGVWFGHGRLRKAVPARYAATS